MEQAKLLITPFELFSSTIGGLTMILAAILIYLGISDIHALYTFIHQSIDIKNFILLISISFLLGGLTANITYHVYKKLSELLNINNEYYDINKENIIKFNNNEELSKAEFLSLSYPDRIGYFLSKRVNNIETFHKSIISVVPYIRQRDIYAARLIEHNMAQHIMYRGLSFGFLLMTIAIYINMITYQNYSVNSFAFLILTTTASILSFYKCSSFLRWHRREIINSFYQIAYHDTFEKNILKDNTPVDNKSND